MMAIGACGRPPPRHWVGWGRRLCPVCCRSSAPPRHKDTTEARRLALEALGVARDASALTPLLYALEREEEPSLRAAAATALGNLTDARALPYLLRGLSDERPLPAENERVCDYAAEALAAFSQEGEAATALARWREQQGLSATPSVSALRAPTLEDEPSIRHRARCGDGRVER